jgi:hypothetical protein
MPSRKTTIGAVSILAVSGLVASVAAGTANASPAAHRAPAAAKLTVPKPNLVKGGKVIVVLKDQHTPASQVSGTTHVPAAVAQASRSKVAAAVRSVGGTVRTNLSIVNAVAATMSTKQATALAQRSDVAEVIPDARIKEAVPAAVTPQANPPQPPTAPIAGACPTNSSDAQLGPEALRVTHADSDVAGAKTARSLGYTGAGVTVAYMAEGIDINNPDFMRDGKSIFSDYVDFSGDGLDAPTTGGEAFLDASSIAAQGNVVYNLRNYSDRPLSQDCKIRIEGEAPGVNLVGIKVFSNGFTTTSDFLQGIQYAVAKKVDILNESFGGNPIPDTSQDVTRVADDAAVAAGVTVTVSSGDAGITNTIGSPASDPHVIAVGASTTFQSDIQTGESGGQLPGVTGWKNNNISAISSSGFDASGRTVTLVAPGDSTFVVCTADVKMYSDCTDDTGAPSNFETSGGTSESAPTVAGVAALVIQAYREGHNDANPSPGVVRRILTGTADDLGAPAEQQGAGLVDAYKAVELAKAYGTHGTPTGTALENNSVRYNAVAAPRTPETFTDTLTNDGTTTQKITASGRGLGAYKSLSATDVRLSDKSSLKYFSAGGYTDNYETVNFTVPAGQARLSTSIAYQGGADLLSPVYIALIDPQGDFVGDSLPQGFPNFGHAEVANPVAGKWTADIVNLDAALGGFNGKVHFSAAIARYKTFGSVSPATLTLAPGKSGKVTMHVGTMATPGDLAGSLVLSSDAPGTDGTGGTVTTVPVTLRSEIPTGSQKFTQTLTGGNGRAGGPGVVFTYQTTVGKNVPELNAAVRLNLNPRNQFEAVLVSPDGNAAAFAANFENTTSPVEGPVTGLIKGVQLHTLDPAPGRWTLLVEFSPVVSGMTTSTPFTVSTDETARVATAAGLPDSKKTILKAGKTERYFVRIKNTGPSPESYFVDGRLSAMATYSLASVTGPDATAPPTDNIPTYTVPSNTSKIAAVAVTDGTQPIQFDMSGPIGDPDIESSTGTEADAFYSGTPVSPGAWFVIPSQVGPYTAAATPEDVETAMEARTLAFDPALTSSTGDLWLSSIDPSTTVNTVTVDPGDTAVIQVKITPTKGKHSVVGTLFVDDANLIATEGGSSFQQPNADQVAAIHYRYSVVK